MNDFDVYFIIKKNDTDEEIVGDEAKNGARCDQKREEGEEEYRERRGSDAKVLLLSGHVFLEEAV